MAIKETFRFPAARTLLSLEYLVKQLNEAQPGDFTRSCLNCDHFTESQELCTKFNQRPPARVIAFSCVEHSNLNDDIPF